MQKSDPDVDQNIDPIWIKIPTPTLIKNGIRLWSTFWPQFWSKAGSSLDQTYDPNFDRIVHRFPNPFGRQAFTIKLESTMFFNDLKNNAIQHRPELGPQLWSKTWSDYVQKSDPDVDQNIDPIWINIPTPTLIKNWIRFWLKFWPT